MWIIVVGIIIVIISVIFYKLNKNYKDNFFSLFVRDEEESIEDLTGRWDLIDRKTCQKVPNHYMSFEEDGTFILSAACFMNDANYCFMEAFMSSIKDEDMSPSLTLKGAYIVRKDQNQSIMQKMIKDPENYEWYHVLIDITEPSFLQKPPTIAYGIGINKNNGKGMVLCELNPEEVCEWNDIEFLALERKKLWTYLLLY